ncbi:MAG: CBS domain-containing protein [Chloroflexi bacterium]|nr:CBS domain-containing protein [Chloroflexota bacterium]
MKVCDIMTPNPISIEPEHSIGTALTRMRRGGFRRLPVVTDGKLIGIVTDRDLRLAMNSPFVLREGWYDSYLMEHIEVRSCMTADPITITADADIIEAVQLLKDHKIGGVPVVEKKILVGVLTETDLLNYLLHLLQEQQPHTTV